jgi:hypothetical protein
MVGVRTVAAVVSVLRQGGTMIGRPLPHRGMMRAGTHHRVFLGSMERRRIRLGFVGYAAAVHRVLHGFARQRGFGLVVPRGCMRGVFGAALGSGLGWLKKRWWPGQRFVWLRCWLMLSMVIV